MLRTKHMKQVRCNCRQLFGRTFQGANISPTGVFASSETSATRKQLLKPSPALPCSQSMMQAACLKCSECLGTWLLLRTWLLLGSQGSNICSCLVGPSREPTSHQLVCWPVVRQSTDARCFQYALCNTIM